MLIQMFETAAGPDGVLHAGKVFDLPKAEAEVLLQVGTHGKPYAKKAERGAVASEAKADYQEEE